MTGKRRRSRLAAILRLEAIPPRARVLAALCVLVAGLLFGPLGSAQVGASEVTVPYEWYRYQGEADSGPDATYNCEVTTATMAIQLVRGGLRVPIRDVRAVIGHPGATVTADAKKALRYWGVQTNDIDNIDQVVDAVRRGHTVVVGLNLGAVSTGQDLGQPRSPVKMRTGRYSSYSGAHSIVVRGVSADGQWLTVYDPNHWDGNAAYLYSDGTPKGKDRLYKTSEVAAGMRELVDFPRALEIIGTNAPAPAISAPPSTAVPGSAASDAPAGKPAPRQTSDLTVLVSGGGGWSTVVLSFAVKNYGDGAIAFDAIGVRGSRPNGQPFEALLKSVVLDPGAERQVSILTETPDTGEWQAKSVGYLVAGQWRELATDGRQNRASFRIGRINGATPQNTLPVSNLGKKPGGSSVPGP